MTSADEKQAIFNNDKAIQVFEWFLKVYDAQGGDDAVTEAFGKKASIRDALAQAVIDTQAELEAAQRSCGA